MKKPFSKLLKKKSKETQEEVNKISSNSVLSEGEKTIPSEAIEEVKEKPVNKLLFDIKTGELVTTQQPQNDAKGVVVDQIYEDGFFSFR